MHHEVPTSIVITIIIIVIIIIIIGSITAMPAQQEPPDQ
jgi:hypothetical protein